VEKAFGLGPRLGQIAPREPEVGEGRFEQQAAVSVMDHRLALHVLLHGH
jgi:hypothetical protein